MSKKRSWLCLIKRLFFPETHQQHQQKRSKRRKWLFGRFRKIKELPSPPLRPPPPPPPPLDVDERSNEFEEDALKLMSKCVVEEPKSLKESIPIESEAFPLNHECEDHVNNMAAIKIQTSYRGYLARKALKALKGFVRLQAIIRGRAVRRQAMTTLKCLQAIVNIQSEVCTRRNELLDDESRNLKLHGLSHDKPKIQVESNRRPRLDDRLLSKEEEIDIILRKKEAILRRQRTKAYSFNHRHSTDSEDGKSEARLRYWLEQYVSDQSHKNNEDKSGGKQLKWRNTECINNPHLISLPRRSFHNHSNKQNSHREDGLHPSSPSSTPTYMAATESAKARTRSTSSPRVRPMHFESYSDSDSPYKHKISPMSSMNSEVTCLSKISNKSGSSSQQKSPSFKGVPGSIRSMRNLRDVNLDSDSLLVSRGSR